jgi:hypothetical protein
MNLFCYTGRAHETLRPSFQDYSWPLDFLPSPAAPEKADLKGAYCLARYLLMLTKQVETERERQH